MIGQLPDPADELKRRLRMPGLPGQKKKQAAYPPLPPAEEKSLLSDVLATGTSGLQYLGETLDKPGRALRQGLHGLVTGDIGKAAKGALNLIPFSDTMGLTDPAEGVSGKDVLQASGLQDKLTPEQEANLSGMERFGRGAAGFAAEVALDPLSYMTFGASALGKAGKVAKAAGISVKGANRFKTLGEHLATAAPEVVKQAETAAAKHGTTLAELAGEKLGGAFGLSTGPLGLLGVSGSHVPQIAQGPAAQAAIEGLGKGLKAVGQTKPALIAKGFFTPEAGGQFTKHGQMAANYAYEARHSAKAKAMMAAQQAADDLDSLAKDVHEMFGPKLGTSPEGTANLVRSAAQLAGEVRHKGAPAAGHALKEVLGTGNQETKAKLAEVMQGLVGQQDSIANSIKSKGGNLSLMFENQGESPIGHFARFLNTAKQNIGQFAARQLKTSFEGAIKRSDPIRYIPAPVLNKMLNDPALMALKGDPAAHAKALVAGYRDELMRAATAGRQKSIEKAAAETAEIQAKADAKALKKGIAPTPVNPVPIDVTPPSEVRDALSEWLRQNHGKLEMGEDAVVNHARYMRGAHIADANLDAIHKMLHDSIEAGGVPLASAFKQIGLKPEEALNYFGNTFKVDPLQTLVHPDSVAATKSFLAKSQKPEWAHHVTDLVDKYTKWFKQNVTLPWPGFASRNHLSGQWMNLASTEIPDIAHAGKYAQEYNAALGMLKNPEAHKALLDELAAHRVFNNNDVTALGTEIGSQNLGWNMKRTPNPILSQFQNLKDARARANEVGFGLGPRMLSETRFAKSKPVKAAISLAATPAHFGAEVNKQVEFLNRVPMYTYLRKHLGWGPEQAAAKVRELQVDYEALAPFEKEVMRRLVPFYSWQRRIVPVMLDQMLQRPGGVTAQTIRGSNIGRSKDEFVPPYVGEGMSVNLGGDRYLSGLGLPTDQFADLFVKGPTALGSVKRTGQKVLSQMNPLVKGPLETMTGINTFTGRPVEESFPYPTKNVLLNQVIHNSPLARAATSARQLGDTRKEPLTKAMNLLTGLRITDTSGGLAKQQSLAESKMLQEILREDPNIGASTDVYVKKSPETGLPVEISDETRKRMQVLTSLKKRAAEEAKRKKKRSAPLAQ